MALSGRFATGVALAMSGPSPAPPAPLPRKAGRCRARLETARDVRRELASVYRMAKDGRLASDVASRLGNLLAILCRMLETSDLEHRLEQLEAEHQRHEAMR